MSRRVICTCALLFAITIGCDRSSPEQASLITTYFERFNAHDWEGMAGMYASNASFLDPAFGTVPIRLSHAEVVKKYAELQAVIPDVHDSVVSVHCTGGNDVFVEFNSSGTGPDGQPFSLPLMTRFTLKDGLITSDRTYYDNPCEPQ
jgi:ketosteroid isomerase-like protein